MKKYVSLNLPLISNDDAIIYEEGKTILFLNLSGMGLDEEEEEVYLRNSNKKLSELKIKDQDVLSIDDFTQQFRFNVIFQNTEIDIDEVLNRVNEK